ncbi:MAG: putative rane protein [Polaromonas sp.]|nr:putative rane protein [Polaromonas sp.]
MLSPQGRVMSAGPSLQPLRHLGALAAMALLLCLTAIFNGQPFFYPDTPTYLRGAEMGVSRLLGPSMLKPWLAPQQKLAAAPSAAAPAAEAASPTVRLKPLTSVEDKVVLSGRSPYYGALVYAGYLGGGMWLAVVLQALAVAYLLYLLMVQLWGLRAWQAIGVTAALSLLTPLGLYTGFLMPDVFAPLVILCIGLLAVYWKRLAGGHRWAVSILLLFGLAAHASHLALAVFMLALLLAARLVSARWRVLPWAGLLVLAGCIGGALGAEWAFSKAVTKAVGAPPLRLPHLTARLIDLGPGTVFLRQHCPAAGASGYAACGYLQNYPIAWDDFLFSTDPAKGAFALADAAAKRRLSDEQLGLALQVLRADPAGVIGGVSADVLRQIVSFQVDIGQYSDKIFAMYEGRVPDSIFADMHASRAGSGFPFNRWLTASSYAMVLASALMLGLWWRRRSAAGLAAPPPELGLSDFVLLVVAGVVANALVCGALASLSDRFQARAIWLLPFLALSVLAMARRPSPSDVRLASASQGVPAADFSLKGVPP